VIDALLLHDDNMMTWQAQVAYNLAKEAYPTFLGALNRRLEESGTGYFVGDKVSKSSTSYMS